LLDSAGEEHHVLQHETDVPPEGEQVPLADVDALHEDRTRCRRTSA
jgi:hypothetical protein